MDECKFCAGQKVGMDGINEGWRTAMQSIGLLFGVDEDEEPHDYIRWDEENKMMWAQTSSGEYADAGFEIQYCPYCGRKL